MKAELQRGSLPGVSGVTVSILWRRKRSIPPAAKPQYSRTVRPWRFNAQCPCVRSMQVRCDATKAGSAGATRLTAAAPGRLQARRCSTGGAGSASRCWRSIGPGGSSASTWSRDVGARPCAGPASSKRHAHVAAVGEWAAGRGGRGPALLHARHHADSRAVAWVVRT